MKPKSDVYRSLSESERFFVSRKVMVVLVVDVVVVKNNTELHEGVC